MRLEQCEKCSHFHAEPAYCKRHHRLIAKIRGCSHSPSGKRFFRAKSGQEAFRLKYIGKKGEAK